MTNATDQPDPDEPPQLLGERYALRGRLGSGSLATVWRAEDVQTGETVAVKLAAQAPDDVAERAAVSVAEEGRVLAGLDHPGIVHLRDTGEHEQRPYLVLDLVPGLPLHLRREWQPVEVARVGAGVADALACVHDAGLVHGDVSPANVVLDADEQPRLLDFSTARPPGTRPRAGEVVGTPPFLAPEQVRGVMCTAASDVWSLGLVLLECVTGRREYPGPSLDAAVARLRRPPQVPGTVPPGVGRALRAALDESLAARPSARQLAEMLHTCADDAAVESADAVASTTSDSLSTAALAVPPSYAPAA